MHMIIYSLTTVRYGYLQPPNCERHGKPKTLEPLKELKVIRVVLVLV